ncbi:MAG: hypothetical protein RIR11_1136 [Bacteroidota bacterium]|jgi:hypothetical protein
MKKIFFTLFHTFFILFFSIEVLSQSTIVESVAFFYPSENAKAFIDIRNDNTGVFFSSTSLTPGVVKSWENNVNIAPVAYVSGYTPRVRSKFKHIGPTNNCTQTCSAKGEVYINNVLTALLPPKELQGGAVYPTTQMVRPNNPELGCVFDYYTIRYIPDLKIKWYISTTPNIQSSWAAAGETNHKLYILHNHPKIDDQGNGFITSFLETSFYLSCTGADGKGANAGSGLPETDEVALSIYDIFRTRNVKKLNGNKFMGYWEDGPSDCTEIQPFLAEQNGSCGIWAGFLNDMFRLQGLQNTGVSVIVYGQDFDFDQSLSYLTAAQEIQLESDLVSFFGNQRPFVKKEQNPASNKTVAALFVKNWGFNNANKFYLVESTSNNQPLAIPSTNNSISFINNAGLPAQGENNNNPPFAAFPQHAITKYKNSSNQEVYFDPSYGAPSQGWFLDKNDWEKNSIEAYGTVVYYFKDGPNADPIEIIWVSSLDNNALLETSFH